jgi:hypothetical protein
VPVSKAELEREVDRLYQLPLSEFTARANATSAAPVAAVTTRLERSL